MNDLDWVSAGKGTWRYVVSDPNTYRWDEALIQVRGEGQWFLYINRQHIGTFNTWAEARDATPMMISLHGFTGNQS